MLLGPNKRRARPAACSGFVFLFAKCVCYTVNATRTIEYANAVRVHIYARQNVMASWWFCGGGPFVHRVSDGTRSRMQTALLNVYYVQW